VRLSTKGRYAVMAMVDLAKFGKGSPVALSEIAERQEISLSYLEQLFAKLRRAQLVNSVRGPGGGYVLSHAADETRIADIILAVDEPIRATRCSLGSAAGCAGNKGRCVTHDLWEELSNPSVLQLDNARRCRRPPGPRQQRGHSSAAAKRRRRIIAAGLTRRRPVPGSRR